MCAPALALCKFIFVNGELAGNLTVFSRLFLPLLLFLFLFGLNEVVEMRVKLVLERRLVDLVLRDETGSFLLLALKDMAIVVLDKVGVVSFAEVVSTLEKWATHS